MSTGQLFTMRDKIRKCNFQQFKQFLTQNRKKSNPLDQWQMTNLFQYIYGTQKSRKQKFDFLRYFAQTERNLLHIEINKGRRLLQQICIHTRIQQLRQLIELFLDMKQSFKLYSIDKLIAQAIDQPSNNQDNIVALINELIRYQKYIPDCDQTINDRKDYHYVCLKALKKDMLLVAYQIVKNQLGLISQKSQQLLYLPLKINKKGNKMLKLFQNFLVVYFEKTRINPYVKDNQGRFFWQKMSKQQQEIVHRIKSQLESQMQQRQPGRRSDNKVRSSMGQNDNLKQHNSQALHENYRQRMVINIQNTQDQISVQKQANKIYQNIITEKQKIYKYEKKQNREGAQKIKRSGIIKSQQLRYYLEQDIKMQVQAIKNYNQQYKQHFYDLINKLKQKLSTPLNITLQVFGSFRTQLCLPESDIDIAITSASQQFRLNPIKLLEQIQYILEQQEMKEYIENVKFIKTATVPIIKVTCTEKYWNKKVDFTYQGQSHNGLQSVLLIKSYLKQYPQLQSLIFVLKKFIYISNLCAPYLGGISSYGLILMIVAYIQQQYKTNQAKAQKLLTADLLIGFLKFYGYKVNYVMKSIQVLDNNNSWQTYKSCIAPYNDPNSMMDFTPKLVIIDPLNENNNVGRPTHKIKQIQMAFEIAFISIHTFRRCGKKRRCESYRRINRLQMPQQVKFRQNQRPCCILKRMFSCTDKFINEHS